eukprot:3197285-Rhodomonas_salina.2
MYDAFRSCAKLAMDDLVSADSIRRGRARWERELVGGGRGRGRGRGGRGFRDESSEGGGEEGEGGGEREATRAPLAREAPPPVGSVCTTRVGLISEHHGIVLRIRYAMPGTEIACVYWSTHSLCDVWYWYSSCLSSYAFGTRCPVLTKVLCCAAARGRMLSLRDLRYRHIFYAFA